jgi:uncharacterized protein YuzE
MRIEYGPTIGALYVRLRPGDVADTVEVDIDVDADLDEAGEPIGVEFLDADGFFSFVERYAGTSDGLTVVDLPDGVAALVRERAAVAPA